MVHGKGITLDLKSEVRVKIGADRAESKGGTSGPTQKAAETGRNHRGNGCADRVRQKS